MLFLRVHLLFRNVDIKQHFTMAVWILLNAPLSRSSGAKMKSTLFVPLWHLEWVMLLIPVVLINH